MLKKKVIVLSGEICGAIKLESMGDKCTCSLALTNLVKPCYAIIKLGNSPSVINFVEKVKFTLRIDGSIQENVDVACMLMDDNSNVLAKGKLGKTANFYYAEQEFDAYIKKRKEKSTVLNADANSFAENLKESTTLDSEADIEPAEQQYIEAESAVNDNVSDCQSCNIADAAMLRTTDQSNEPFYLKVADRLDELFTQYPHDTELESLVHSSQWVRVEYDDTNYYVVGLIKEDNMPLFICYGVPVDNKSTPNPETPNCEWLPISRDNLDGKGYWVLYQDALSGETLT